VTSARMEGQLVTYLTLLGVLVGAQKIADGPRGEGTVFEKCGGGFFSSANDRCYKVTVSKLSVQMGDDGTDDDVKVKICSDIDPKKPVCCTTPALKRFIGDDWSKGDLENWKAGDLGTKKQGGCKDQVFKINKGLDVTLLKKASRDSLKVTSIIIDTEGETGVAKKKSFEQFRCGGFEVKTSSNSSKTVRCGSSGLHNYERVKEINVTMGNQGTNNDVRVDICSDVNSYCCRTKLSSLLSDDWSKNDEEIWKESDLGKCATSLYKVNRGLKVSLVTKKVAKKGLVVNKLLVNTENLQGSPGSYDCKGYSMTGKEIQENICTRKTPTRRGSAANKKNKKTSSRTTTTKKGLLSQGQGLLSRKSTTTTTRRPFRSAGGK